MILSIITINYNNAEGLRRTLKSVKNHRNPDFEHIVIDGGSNDHSITIIKEYEEHINYWISEPDSGIYNAMNKGIERASGDYLLFLNSGDELLPDIKFDDIIKQAHTDDIIYFNLNIQHNDHCFTKTYPLKLDFLYFIKDSLPHTATFIKRKSLIEYGGYNESMKICADWAFFIYAICLNNLKYRYVNQVFSVFYADGISSDPHNRNLVLDEKLKYIEDEFPQYYTITKDYFEKSHIIWKLKESKSINLLRKLGCAKWINNIKE